MDADVHVTGESPRCRNCGANAPGNYCGNCGQETSIALPTAGVFLREAAGRYVALDGRMWRSLHALLFRPGHLTREYLAGRRRRYVRPARLFVALSIVFFAVLRFTEAAPVLIDTTGEAARQRASAAASQDGATDAGREDRIPRVTLDPREAQWLERLGPLRGRFDAFNRLPREEKADAIIGGMLRYAPYAAIALLPLFALLVGIAYAGGRRRHPARPTRYAAHLVFGAHNHAFLFLCATLVAVVAFTPLRAVLVVWMIVYGLASMKAVYGGSWGATVARAAVIAIAYGAFFILAVLGLLAAAVILR